MNGFRFAPHHGSMTTTRTTPPRSSRHRPTRARTPGTHSLMHTTPPHHAANTTSPLTPTGTSRPRRHHPLGSDTEACTVRQRQIGAENAPAKGPVHPAVKHPMGTPSSRTVSRRPPYTSQHRRPPPPTAILPVSQTGYDNQSEPPSAHEKNQSPQSPGICRETGTMFGINLSLLLGRPQQPGHPQPAACLLPRHPRPAPPSPTGP